MKTRTIFYLLLTIIAACGKDDTPQPKDPDPVQQPDPKHENRPPGSFELVSPVMDGMEERPSPVFIWNAATDPDGDKVSYDLYVDTAEAPQTSIAEDLSTATFALLEHLNFKTKYHWKVVARDAKGAETESAIGSFTTDLPIAFIKEFDSGLEGGGILSFDYNQGFLTGIANETGTSWGLDYDKASGTLSRTSRELNGEFVTYDYEYTSFGKQKSIKLGRSGKNESWNMDYDGNERLTSVVYEIEENGGDVFKVTVTLTYGNENSWKPVEIAFVTTESDSPETTEITTGLEWDAENIVSSVIEGVEEGEYYSVTAKYTYDNNINPYHILTKQQFGFDEFFVLNIRTGMEGINFGPLVWQSSNNIVKMELIQTSVKGGSNMSSDTYEYLYSEGFYPLAATGVYRGGMSAEETRELSWSY